MELDQAVILFDEIDELVREREGGHEAFGRFLTTSMLPKLAELWKQRKTLYFVATNHIGYFDRAITRSERFDATILVAPPSYQAKLTTLRHLLGEQGNAYEFEASETEIWSELEIAGQKRSDAPLDDCSLAKFVLLRHDQLNELALNIRQLIQRRFKVDIRILRKALDAVRDRSLDVAAPYVEFCNDIGYSRRDYGKYQVWAVDGGGPSGRLPKLLIEDAKGLLWLKTTDGAKPPAKIKGRAVRTIPQTS